MEGRIKGMYNDCWLVYKKYLEAHDIGQYNKDAAGLMDKYGRQADICDLLLWWAPRINMLHEGYARRVSDEKTTA